MGYYQLAVGTQSYGFERAMQPALLSQIYHSAWRGCLGSFSRTSSCIRTSLVVHVVGFLRFKMLRLHRGDCFGDQEARDTGSLGDIGSLGRWPINSVY